MYNLIKGDIFPNLKCIKSVFISYEQCMNRRTPKNFSLYRKISQATSVPSTTIDQWIPVPEKQESPIEKKMDGKSNGLGLRVRKKSTKTPHANGESKAGSARERFGFDWERSNQSGQGRIAHRLERRGGLGSGGCCFGALLFWRGTRPREGVRVRSTPAGVLLLATGEVVRG